MANSTVFKQLCLAALSRYATIESKRVLTTESASLADEKYNEFLTRVGVNTFKFQDDQKPYFARQFLVTVILAMFDDTEGDDLVYFDDEVNIDKSKSIIMAKIADNKLFETLAGIESSDYTAIIADGSGNWTQPSEKLIGS